MRIVIVGAGLAGLACAEKLSSVGHVVTLFDKGRGPGGRMSTRRIETRAGEAAFDLGAQYFTVRHPEFRSRVDRWRRDGWVAPWPAAGADAWVGAPAMNAPVRQMADGLNVCWSARVDSLTLGEGRWRVEGDEIAGQTFDVAVVATPAEQAQPLLEPWDPQAAARAAAALSQPCWTVIAAFAEPLTLAPDTIRDLGPIAWAARNNTKPCRVGPESWVIQAGAEWSQAHLEESHDKVQSRLLKIFTDGSGVRLPEILAATTHRWRYARTGGIGERPIWNRDLGLGVCGDWLLGPRVEFAWLSGDFLADQIIADPRRL